MRSIYLDANSTAPLCPEAADAMSEAYSAGYANPASQHAEGRRARRVLESARERFARLLGADLSGRSAPSCVFTSGGTEANNLAILGLRAQSTQAQSGRPRRMVVSAIEHPSVLAAAEALQRDAWQVDRLRVTSTGTIDLAHLEELLAEPARLPQLVSVMLVNNETGVVQPVAEVARRCTARGVPVHCDASQAAGKLVIDFDGLGLGAMTIAAHKFGGPRGIGALIARRDFPLRPLTIGGAQQGELRAGTESVALTLGMLAALASWDSKRQEHMEQLAMLRDRFEAGVLAMHPRAVVNGAAAERLPTTSNIAFAGWDRQALFMALDLAGVCCSTGSACASGSSEPSPTLAAMGLAEDVVASSLRFSFSRETTEAEIDEALARMARVLNVSS